MAIVKMKKFTLFTFESYKPSLLKELQKFGDVHFKDLQTDSNMQELAVFKNFIKDGSQEKANFIEAQLERIKFCLSKLEPYVIKPKGLKALTIPQKALNFEEFDCYADNYDAERVYKAIKAEDERINAAKVDITKLKAENEGLRNWLKLDVSIKELDRQKFVKYIIGTVNKAAAESFRIKAEEKYNTAYVEYIGNIKDDITALIIVLSQDFDEAFEYFKNLGFSRLPLSFIDIPSGIINKNNDEISRLQAVEEDAREKLKGLSGEYESLQILCDYYESALERECVCLNFVKLQTVFMAVGWVPKENTAELNEIVTGICGANFYMEDEDAEKDSEEVPIKLKNNEMVSAFEDITVMFSLPKYNEIDPTPILMPFYMIFFGLMMGDIGYGLVMLAGTSVALKFFNLKDGSRNFIKFFFYLSFATIIGGLIYGGMFGYTVFTPIVTADGTKKAILDSQADVMTMMMLSIALGTIQVIFGIGVKGYMLMRDKRPFAAIFDSLFYIITLVSAIGLLLCAMLSLPQFISTISMWSFFGGLVGLAATQGRDANNLVGKIASGLYAVYGLTSYVGDLVSYTRIAALALSGAYIAFSFNLMAGLIPGGFPRIIFGSAIFLIGQALNLGLSALGAYVHTCRLQYVEYFGKFYEGGGVPFSAFKLKNIFIKITK